MDPYEMKGTYCFLLCQAHREAGSPESWSLSAYFIFHTVIMCLYVCLNQETMSSLREDSIRVNFYHLLGLAEQVKDGREWEEGGWMDAQMNGQMDGRCNIM